MAPHIIIAKSPPTGRYMVVYSQTLPELFELMLKECLKVYLKDTPVSAYTVHSNGLGLMSLTSVVILSRKIILARLGEHTGSRSCSNQ